MELDPSSRDDRFNRAHIGAMKPISDKLIKLFVGIICKFDCNRKWPEASLAWLNLSGELKQNTAMQTNSEARWVMYMYILSWRSDLELRTCI